MREINYDSKDSTGQYLDEIARVPLLNAEQEVELSKDIEAGLMAECVLDPERAVNRDYSEEEQQIIAGLAKMATREELEWMADNGQRAKDRFLESNLRLVVSIARKYGHSGMPLLDLIQEGNTGLVRAVEKFDYTKGFKFSTYASWWVRQAITRGIAQQARTVRIPIHVVEEINQVTKAQRNLESDLNREVEPEEIAAKVGKDVERVMDLLSWSRDHISLDDPLGEDGDFTLGDMIQQETMPGPEMSALHNESSERLNDLVDMLGEREADIIRSRFGMADGRLQKLAEIGLRHGLSPERTRQLEKGALEKLRDWADPDLAS